MTTNSKLQLNPQSKTKGRDAYSGLRAPGWFARWPVLGLTMIIFGSLLFGAMAYGVEGQNSFVLQWDISSTARFHSQLKNLPASLVEYVIFGFFLGKELAIITGTILALYFSYKRYWRELSMVLVGLGGGALIWYILSQYFDRPRPAGQMAVLAFSDPAFPSGPALIAVLCYGLLGYLLIPRLSSRFMKWLVAIVLTFVIIFVGVSTLLWGSQYVTDVIAGYALGLAWAGLIYTLMETFFSEKSVPSKENSLRTTSPEDFRTPGWFKKWPVAGIVIILLGTLAMAGLSYNLLAHGPLLQIDNSVYHELIAQAKSAPPVVNEIMIFGFFVGKQVVLVIVTILSIYFIYKRFWRELAMLLLSSAAGSLIWNLLIAEFARPRPPIQTGLAVTTIPSFPSGHTMSALICYGFLAYLLIPRAPTLFWKWIVGLAAAAIVLFVGFSRVYQGGHYLTDAVGGYALGLAWAGLIYLLIEYFFWRKKA